MVWWVVLLIAAGMAALGQLLQPKIEDAKPESELRFPSNDETRPIPVPFGRVLVAPQLLYRGDFKAVPIVKKIFTGFWFKKIITGYRYHIGLILGLAYARAPLPESSFSGTVVTGIIWKDRYVWQHPGTSTYITSATIDEPTYWGAEKEEGGLFGKFNFYPGDNGPGYTLAPSAYWESQTGQDMPNYRNVSYVEWLGYSQTLSGEHCGYVGNSGALEDLLFRVMAFPPTPLSVGSQIGINAEYCNPIHALYECFTNADFGMGLSDSRLDLDSWNAAAGIIVNEVRGFNYLWDRQTTIEEFANEILRYVNGVVYTDLATGKICITLARGGSSAGLDTLDKTSFLDTPQLNRPHWSETKNQVRLHYTDQSVTLQPTKSVDDVDLVNYGIQGVLVPADVHFKGCPSEAIALQLAAEARRALATPLLRLSGKLSRAAYDFTPGTRFIYDDPTEDITDVVMIVNRVKYGTIVDGTITIEAIEDIFAYGTASYGPAVRITNDILGDPAQATLYGAIEVPYWFQRDDLNRPLVYAARPNDASISYDVALAGEIQEDEFAFAPTGTLTQDYEQLTDPTDNSGTLVIGSLVDKSELENVSAALIASEAAQLIYFASTGEIAAFESFTDNGTTITLNNVWRGVLDTPPMAHVTGERVWFLSYGLGLNELSFDGSLAIKFLPKSVRGAISLAETTASTTLNEADRALRPHPVRYVRINGSYTDLQPTGDLVSTWRESNRFTETTVVKQDNATLTPEAGTTYEIDIYGEDGTTLLRAVTGLTSPTYTYTNANELSDSGKSRLEFELTLKHYSKRDGLRSKYAWERKVFRIDPSAEARITETSEIRITEAGERRITG